MCNWQAVFPHVSVPHEKGTSMMIKKTGIKQILATVILLGRFKTFTSKIYAALWAGQCVIDLKMIWRSAIRCIYV